MVRTLSIGNFTVREKSSVITCEMEMTQSAAGSITFSSRNQREYIFQSYTLGIVWYSTLCMTITILNLPGMGADRKGLKSTSTPYCLATPGTTRWSQYHPDGNLECSVSTSTAFLKRRYRPNSLRGAPNPGYMSTYSF